jgi:hypothetical protein
MYLLTEYETQFVLVINRLWKQSVCPSPQRIKRKKIKTGRETQSTLILIFFAIKLTIIQTNGVNDTDHERV